MRLKVPEVDLRSDNGSRPIIDEESGNIVGQILYGQHYGRTVYLFDDKYQGSFGSNAECAAFVQGVQTVLNHMTAGSAKHKIK